MSVQWLSWVFDAVEVVGGQRLVLLSLANHADDRGVCWPSIDTLSKEARLSRRRVEEAIRGLVATGIVQRTVNGAPVPGSNRPNLYRLIKAPDETAGAESSAPADVAPDESSGPDEMAPAESSSSPRTIRPAQPRTNRPAKPSVEPSNNRQEPHVVEPRSDIDSLCALLAERVGTHRDGPSPPVTKRWRTDMRLLIDRGPLNQDQPTPLGVERVERAIRFCFDRLADANGSGFCWADQVRSPQSLRKHWHQLATAAKNLNRAHTPDQAWRDSEAIHEAIARGDIDPHANPLDALTARTG